MPPSDNDVHDEVLVAEGTDRRRLATLVGVAFGAIAMIACIAIPFFTEQPGLWAMIPIVTYAVLVLVGFNILISTAFASALAIAMAQLSLPDIGTLLTDSLGSFIATIGLIIMLGAGLGAIARESGAASALVQGLVNRIGVDTPHKVQLGIMLSSTVLVGALGTLAGANAILAPLIIPIAARVKWSRPAVAAMIHTAGAAGLMIGPFTPPVVTVMGAAGLTYFEYLYSAGLPMAATTWIVGFFSSRWVQRRTQDSDPYSADDRGAATDAPSAAAHQGAAAWAFVGSIVIMTVIGISIKANYTFAIIVMLVAALITALLGRLPAERAINTFTTGAASLIWLFFLFWMFNPMLVLVEESGAYDALLAALNPTLHSAGPWLFLVLSLLLGWLAVPGAAVAQVTLIDKLLWPLAASIGVPPTAWAAALLGGSQIDWFGPLPNGDMIGQMGLARSTNLKMMLFNGWMVMAANIIVLCIVFAILG